MEDIQYAFIDEFGNYSFDFANKEHSTHFIIAAIIVKQSDKSYVEQRVEAIRQMYFPEGTMSSNLIGDDYKKRIKILHELRHLPLSYYAYVIDKRRIYKDSGIQIRNAFFKRLNHDIYDDLSSTFKALDFVINETEGNEYCQSFKSYVDSRSMPDLFNYVSFGFNNSQSDSLLQLANVIAGTLATGHDKRYKTTHYLSFYDILKDKIIRINYWPHEYRSIIYEHVTEQKDFIYDELVLKQSIELALKYIKNNRRTGDIEEKDRVDFLNFLLYKLHENPNQYVYTEEILDNLNAIRKQKINAHYIRSSIVAKLRDRGVLIASSVKGYKIPVNLDDIHDFVSLANSTIQPMLNRIAKAREQILQASNNQIDIFDKPELSLLKRLSEIENGMAVGKTEESSLLE